MLRVIILISAATALLLAVSAQQSYSVNDFQSLMVEDGASSIAPDAFEIENQNLQEEGFIEDIFAKIVGFFNTIFPPSGGNNGTFSFHFGNDVKSNTSESDTAKIEKRDTSELVTPKGLHKLEKQTKEDTDMRDKLLEYVQKDPDTAFKMLNKLREDKADMASTGSKKVQKVQKRDTSKLAVVKPGRKNSKLNTLIPENKEDKQAKEDKDMRDKLMDFVQKNPFGAFDMLTKLREDKASAVKADSKKIQKRDASKSDSAKSSHKIDKETKEDAEMREKLEAFVKSNPIGAFDMFNRLRKEKADLTKTDSKKVQKQDTPEMVTPKALYKIENKSKDDSEMRDQLIDLVQADPEGIFAMLTELKNNRVNIADSNRVDKREVFETASLRPSPTTGAKGNTPAKKDAEMREKLLSFILTNPSGAFSALNKLKEDRAKKQATPQIFKMKRDNVIADESNDDIYYEYIEENDIGNEKELKQDLIIDKIVGAINSRLPEVVKGINDKIHSDIEENKTKNIFASKLAGDYNKISRLYGAVQTEASRIRAFNNAIDRLLDVIVPTPPPSRGLSLGHL